MQDRSHSTSVSQSASPSLSNAKIMDTLDNSSEETPASSAPSSSSASTPSSASSPATSVDDEASVLDQSLNTLRETFDEHKGKLAISAAAMLGLLVYYKWGEKSLAKESPEEYERLQRIKERVRQVDDRRQGERRMSDSGDTPLR